MEMMEAMKARHSVRSYLQKPLEPAVLEKLRREIDECNRESGLHIQLVTGEPKAPPGSAPAWKPPCWPPRP